MRRVGFCISNLSMVGFIYVVNRVLVNLSTYRVVFYAFSFKTQKSIKSIKRKSRNFVLFNRPNYDQKSHLDGIMGYKDRTIKSGWLVFFVFFGRVIFYILYKILVVLSIQNAYARTLHIGYIY